MEAKILGIDPGSLVTGYGIVLERSQGIECITYGVLEGHSKASFSERLLSIGQGLHEILEKYRPSAMAIEKTFFAKNVDSVMKLGHARGVCLYEAARMKIPIFEYSPTEIKLNMVGHGRAGKDQIQFFVKKLLKLNDSVMSKFDMSDALALAIHHCRISATVSKIKEREITT